MNDSSPVQTQLQIPDSGILYHRIHINNLKELKLKGIPLIGDSLHPNLFRFYGGNLSADWSEFSTPEESKNRARIPCKNGIAEFEAGLVRQDGHKVIYDPTEENQSHSYVDGVQSEIKITLSRIARWSDGFMLKLA